MGAITHAESASPRPTPAAKRRIRATRGCGEKGSGNSSRGLHARAKASTTVAAEISGLPAMACNPTSVPKPSVAPRERNPERATAAIPGR